MEANSLHDLKGSISLRAEETGSGFRFFLDDDEESYFDLDLENMAESDDFEFQISFSPLPDTAAGLSAHQHAAGELPLQVTEARNSSQPVPLKYGDQQVYPSEMLLPPESAAPADEGTGAAGLRRKGQLDLCSEKAQGSDSCINPKCMEEEEKQQQQGPAGTTSKKTSMAAAAAAAAKKVNNGATKFFIKFPSTSERIRATLASIMKSYHVLLSLQPKRGHGDGGILLNQERAGSRSSKVYKTPLMRFISRWLATKKKRSSHVGSKNSSAAAAAPTSQRPNVDVVDLDEGVVGSILEAVDFTVGSRSRGAGAGGGADSSLSQPAASSPGRGTRKGAAGAVERHSSIISSAIAHCKISYGTAPGFS